MLRPKLPSNILLLFVSPLAGAAACDSGLPHPPYSPQATSALAPIDLAPPPGRVETIPKRPPDATAWVDGEWVRRHGRWYWLLGRWVRPPVGAKYSPWVVVRARDGTPYYAPSTWKDAKGTPLAEPPPALAYATASGEVVFSAEGVPEQTGRSIKTAPARLPTTEGDAGPASGETDAGPTSMAESDAEPEFAADAGPRPASAPNSEGESAPNSEGEGEAGAASPGARTDAAPSP